MGVDTKTNVTNLMQFLQLVVLILGVAGVFTHLGKRDSQLMHNTEDIKEMSRIASDLLETQITSASNDAMLFESLDSLKVRVSLLEKSR